MEGNKLDTSIILAIDTYADLTDRSVEEIKEEIRKENQTLINSIFKLVIAARLS